jgi:hypothetical protein
MTLESHEFMRRFLLHVLPGGFHRTRQLGACTTPARTGLLYLTRHALRAGIPQPLTNPVLPDSPEADFELA